MSASQRATLAHRKSIRRARQQRRRKIWAALTSVLLALPLMATWILPASADDSLPEYLEITKSVTEKELEPGQTFQYAVLVTCQEEDCENAELVDELPEELVGWQLLDASANAANKDVEYKVHWTQQGQPLADAPNQVEPGTAVSVEFNAQVDDERPELLGMPRGTNFELHLLLKVPEDLAPGDYNVTNEAKVSADNAKTVTDSADIHVEVPIELNAAASKSWNPADVKFNARAESTITIRGKNTSNVGVDRLIVQEPASAEDGAQALAEDSPFTLVDFTEFGVTTLPDGAQVRVEAYVYENDAWIWKTGALEAEASLPAGVNPADVGGLRFTYINADGEIAVGAEGQIELEVAQRAEHRNAPHDDLSKDKHELTNTVSAHVETEKYGSSEQAQASAPYRVTPAELSVEIHKNFKPKKIVAGASTTAELVVSNGGEAVQEVRVTEPFGGSFFDENIKFTGFESGIAFPEGAASGEIEYVLNDGTTGTTPFADGGTPTLPDDVTGFEVVFTAPGNDIRPGAKTEIDFTIETTEAATGDATEVELENIAQAEVEATNGNKATSADSGTLVIITPYISVELDKKVRPSAPATIGDQVIVSLNTSAEVSDRAKLENITIKDEFNNDPDNFWNVFNLTAIAPTEVIADTAFQVAVRDGDGQWVTIANRTAEQASYLYSLDEAAFAAAVGAANLAVADLTGIQFVYDSETTAGFASGTILQPNPVFEVRDKTRIDGSDIADENDVVKNYQNVAVVHASGESDGGTDLTDEDEAVDGSGVIDYENGPGPVGITKAWTDREVNQLTGDERTTNLRWRVSDGFDTVTISDPAGSEASPQDTVFEAFDLRRIKSIQASRS